MNDTQPLAILDAFAWGKPVVASDHISVQQIIRQGENGLMAKCGDIQDLVNNLIILIESPEQISRMAQVGHQDAENEYQFCKVADKLIDFLDSAFI